MYTRYYDGYTNCQAHNTEPEPAGEVPCEVCNCEENQPVSELSSCKTKLPFNMDADDLILIAVLFLIASEGSDDFILPIILGYLLISNT